MAEPLLPGSPAWWLDHLENQLRQRQRRLQGVDDYEGRDPLAFAPEKFRRAFGGLFEEFADNWCPIVVDAVEERLNVEGFRFGENPDADQDAWAIWQANQLDAESQLAHVEALLKEQAAAIVWIASDETPKITVEDPTQVVVATSVETRERAAAVKLWVDDDGRERATLYMPDATYKYKAFRRQDSALLVAGTTMDQNEKWIPRETSGEPWPLATRPANRRIEPTHFHAVAFCVG